MARPSAPPIMNEVLTTPDARPASDCSTSLIAASSTGVKAMPAPKPSRIMLGARRRRTRRRPARAQAAGARPRPARARAERQPDAEAHHELGGEADRERAHDQVRGQEREADLQRGVAEHLLQVQRREEEPREHRGRPEDADDVRDGDVAAPEQASGTSGAATRDSITRKRPSSTAAAPSRPRVCAEPQPASFR